MELRSRILAVVVAAVAAAPAAAAGQAPQAPQEAEEGAPAARDAPARRTSAASGPVLSSVSTFRVDVEAAGSDSLRIRLMWEPPAHGAAPARYEGFLARVSPPHRFELGRTTTDGSEAEFRIARRPGDLDCCPVVDGRAVYMDGSGAGAWDTYPDGPYAQLLTAGVVPLAADGNRGVLVTRQLDPEAALREAARIAAGGAPDTAAAGPPAEAAERLPGAAPREGQETPEGGRAAPEAGSPPADPAPPWLYIAIALLAVVVVVAAAVGFRRGRRG